MNTRFLLRATQRLKGKKRLQHLFMQGKTTTRFPLRCYYLIDATAQSHQIVVSVSRKRVRKAVLRNKIRRRIREAYRLHQHTLPTPTKGALEIGFVYIGKEDEHEAWTPLLTGVRHALNYLAKHYKQQDHSNHSLKKTASRIPN